MIVDGLEITPQLTRAVDPQEAACLLINLVNRRLFPKIQPIFWRVRGFPFTKLMILEHPLSRRLRSLFQRD